MHSLGNRICAHNSEVRQEDRSERREQEPPALDKETRSNAGESDAHRNGVPHHSGTALCIRGVLQARDGVGLSHGVLYRKPPTCQ